MNNQEANFLDVNELIKIYRDPESQNELNKIFENHYQNEQFKINRIVNIYNDMNVSNINDSGRLFFKVTNWNNTTTLNKISKYHFNDGLNIDKTFNNNTLIENIEEKTKIYDINRRDLGFSFCKLNDIHLYNTNMEGLYIQPLIVPNNIPIIKENEFNFKGSIIKYKSPVVYTLPKIKLGSDESLKLLMGTNEFNEDFLMNYFYCSNDIENLIKFENMYSCVDYHMSELLKKRYIHAYVKRLILQKKYELLYDKIVNNKKIGFNINIDLSQLFYIFYKHKDGIFVKYLREYFYNRYIELNHKDFDQTIIDINLSNSKQKFEEYKEKNKNLKELFDYVFEKGGLISGSFALKLFSNAEKWESNDLDIYLPSTDYQVIYDYLRENDYVNYFSGNPKNNTNFNKKYNMRGITQILDKYVHNGPSLQFIFVEVDPWEFIKNQFDFDICMCGIKNDEFLYHHPNLNSFNDTTISDIYIRKMVGDEKDNYSVYRAAKTIERSLKYMKRGFRITNLDHFLHEIEMHLMN